METKLLEFKYSTVLNNSENSGRKWLYFSGRNLKYLWIVIVYFSDKLCPPLETNGKLTIIITNKFVNDVCLMILYFYIKFK